MPVLLKLSKFTFLIAVLIFFCASSLVAQENITEWVQIHQPQSNETVRFKHGFNPTSIKIFLADGRRDSLSSYRILPDSGIVFSLLGYPYETTLFISYQIELSKIFYQNKAVLENKNEQRRAESDTSLTDEISEKQKDDFWAESKLNKSGSLTRGITVGSNQDVSLESGLRLDMSGEIADSVFLIANLTDQSTPIQPDGSTQNLKEFDRVYLQLKSNRHQLEMGDIDVAMNQSVFTTINRRLQGAAYSTTSIPGKFDFLASVARGMFRSQSFNGKEGFQGSYRLTGTGNEPFIIVIAGSEKVYLNGNLLTRGEENDYIIDYSLGELTFTTKRLLNNQSRIVVDFQYLNQDFSRSIMAAQAITKPMLGGKLQIQAGYMREMDSDNTLAQNSLNESDIDILKQAGDDPTKAVVSGVQPFVQIEESKRIPYQRRDTLIGLEHHTFFEPVLNAGNSLHLYDVRFSRVDGGGGSYERAQSDVNGVVYQWVGPGMGSYDTLRTLPRPMDHSMFSLGSQLKVNKNLVLKTEVALSSYDLNRFSDFDDSDNEDFGVYQTVEHQTKNDFAEVNTIYELKYTGTNFRYFDRPEEVDFARKWNLNQFTATEQTIHSAKTNWKFSKSSEYTAEAGLINRSDMDGRRIYSSLQYDEERLPGLFLKNELIGSSNQLNSEKGSWNQHEAELFYRFRINEFTFRPFIGAEMDERIMKNNKSDSLSALSYGQYAFRSGINWLVSDKWTLSYQFKLREDASVLDNELTKNSLNFIHSMDFSVKGTKNFETENSLSFQRRVIDKQFSGKPEFLDEDAIYIKSNSRYRSSDKMIESQIYYDVNSQRTALLQETYIEVGPELGQYVWIDLNNDGVRQIDEFFPEQTPNEGTWLKQYLPSDYLLPSINLISRFRLSINPLRKWNRKTDYFWTDFLRQMNWNGSLDIRENSTTPHLDDIYFLKLGRFLNDSTTITGRISFRSDLELFPESKWARIQLGYFKNDGKNRQTYGTEDMQNTSYSIRTISMLDKGLQWSNEGKAGLDIRKNTSLPSRNYHILSRSYLSDLTIQKSRDFQYGLNLSYSIKRDEYQAQATEASVFTAGGDTRIFLGDKTQINGKIQLKNVNLSGSSGALGNFELTEGSGSGLNWLWSIQATYRNSGLVQTTLNYDGRTVTNGPVIHIARLVVRALF